MIHHTLPEWDDLCWKTGDKPIPEHVLDSLLAAASASPLGGAQGTRILTADRTHIHTKQVVGILATKDCTLEILPKIDGKSEHVQIRRQLIHMLATVHDLDIHLGPLTGVDWQHESLLEILIGQFATMLTETVRFGLPRRYVEEADDLPVLRGRLDTRRQFTALAAMPYLLACRYDSLSSDTNINRLMKATVAFLSTRASLFKNQRLLRELALIYADISLKPVSELLGTKLILDRTNYRWRTLVDLATLLLGGRLQTTASGGVQGFALLFDMGRLFEAYIARVLVSALAGDTYDVRVQSGGRPCLHKIGDSPEEVLQTQPDIMVLRGSEPELVLDTKWKRLDTLELNSGSAERDSRKRVSAADIYQLIAYGQVYSAPRLMLIYPHHAGLGIEKNTIDYRVTNSKCKLTVATVDLSRGKPTDRLRELVHRSPQ